MSIWPWLGQWPTPSPPPWNCTTSMTIWNWIGEHGTLANRALSLPWRLVIVVAVYVLPLHENWKIHFKTFVYTAKRGAERGSSCWRFACSWTFGTKSKSWKINTRQSANRQKTAAAAASAAAIKDAKQQQQQKQQRQRAKNTSKSKHN